MLILAFDTTLAACSAAVFDSEHGRLLARAWQAMERGHAEALPGMIRDTMREAGVTFPKLDRIAVTTGPGTFTGVRIGLAMARGLSLALRKPVAGLTSLEAIRLNLDENPQARPIASLIEARRGEFYLAVYGADGAVLLDPRAVAHAEAPGVVPEGSLVIGTGADRFIDIAGSSGKFHRARAPDLPDAARFAQRATELVPGDDPPQPLYLRPPGAKLPISAGSNHVSVVEATAEHATVIAAMHAGCFPASWPAAEIARLMAMPGAISLIALNRGEPAGFLIARRAADEAEIITIGTTPAIRRRGVARQLVGRLVEVLSKAGIQSLFIEVAAGNAAARALYEVLGFTAAASRPGYYALPDGSREDAVVMRLGL